MDLAASVLERIVPDPQSADAFTLSKLRWSEANAGPGADALRYHRDLLRLRQADPVLAAFRRRRLPIETGVTGRTLVVKLESESGRRAIAANFGDRATVDLPFSGTARIVIHSNEAAYTGPDRPAPQLSGNRLEMPAHSAAFIEWSDA